MCVCILILSAACVSRLHTPRSPGTRRFPNRSPKFGIVDRRPFTDLKLPIWNRQNHIFPFTITLAMSLIFFRIESFPRLKRVQPLSVFRSFRSRSFQSQPSTSTGLRCLYDVGEAGLRGWANWSRGVFYCFFLITNEPCPSFSFNCFFFFFKATSPEPPSTDKGWEGGVNNTGGRNHLLNSLPQVLIEH